MNGFKIIHKRTGKEIPSNDYFIDNKGRLCEYYDSGGCGDPECCGTPEVSINVVTSEDLEVVFL